MDSVVIGVRVLLAVVFVAAGAAKLLDLPGSRQAMRDFGVPWRLADAAGVLLPLAELAAVVLLVLAPTARWGAALAVALLLTFIVGIANALRHGVAPDCHCFGQLHSAPAGRGTLIRNGVLGALGVLAIAAGPGPAIDSWAGAASAAEIVAVALGIVGVGLASYTAQLYFEARRLGADLAVAQRMAAGAPPGLPVGVRAPEFALRSTVGEMISLGDLRARELPILLVFASPGCPSCEQLFPSIRRWQQTLSQRLTIAVISAGSAADNERLTATHGLATVLLQEGREMIEDYRIRGTPTAVLVTLDGEIGSIPAESVFGIEPMVRLVLRDELKPSQPQSVPA